MFKQATIIAAAMGVFATPAISEGLFSKPSESRERAQNSFEYIDYRTGVAAKEEAGGGGIANAGVDEIARQTSNPLGGDFMIFINEFDYNRKSSNVPALDGGESYTYIFQPVIPIRHPGLGPNWISVHRPTFAYVNTDVPAAGPSLGSVNGWADISHFSLLGTSTPSDSALFGPGDLVLAGGVSMNIPVGESQVSNDTWAVGPAVLASYIGQKGVFGGLLQTQFDVEGSTSTYNKAFLQMFYFKNFPGGWQVGGTPILSYDWETDEATIPIGLGVQKTQVFDLANGGKLPVRFQVEARYFVDQPDIFGDDWQLVFSVSPVIPNLIGNLIKGCPAMSMGGC